MNFMRSIYVIKEAVLTIASFFCSKTVLLAPHLKRVFYYHYSNYSFWIAAPDLDAAIKWFEHIGEILRVSEQS